MGAVNSLKQNYRTALLRLLAWLHCGLIVAAPCAAVYEFMDTVEVFHPSMTPTEACLRGTLFAFPVALSYFAIHKLPHLWQFLLASVGIAGLSWLLLGHPAGAVMAAVVCFFRARARMAEELQQSLFETPHVEFFLVFLVIFLISAVVEWPVSQRLSVISGVFYLLVFLAFRGLNRIDEYLSLNRAMHGLPVRRIQRTAGAAVAVAVLLTAALLLPAAWNLSGDYKIEMPSPTETDRHNAEEIEKTAELYYAAEEEADGPLFGEDEGWTLHIPPFVSYLMYAAAVGAVVVLLLTVIYQVFKSFRSSYTDSRDEVRFLAPKNRDAAEAAPGRERNRPSVWDRSPNAQIRRFYRKTVLRAAGETPKRWQSPAEIEAGAGLSLPELHRLYEKARYGKSACTPEDLRTLKEKT